MVVLTQANTSPQDSSALLKLLPAGSLIDEDSYPAIGYLAILATLDDCDADMLINQSSVLTVSINANVPDSSDEQEFAKRSKLDSAGFGIDNASFSTLQERSLVAGKNLAFQSPAPFHLRWLSSLWAKIQSPVLTGETFLNTDGFLYDSSAGNQVNVYVLDTGISSGNVVSCVLHVLLAVLDLCPVLCDKAANWLTRR
jgi:hypothetical protein